jgi:N,N'-diacetyllegionaminate synthase|tara:strand:+ start:229 stop:1236 length:1008 start_codon:yes stop_codon:yes gene_type:complete
MEKTFVIAEIGINHCGKLSIAKKLISVAKKAGADAVKFQTFKTEKLIRDNEPLMSYQSNNMKKIKTNQFQMLKKCELNHAQHKKLFLDCKKKKIEFISTPYDIDSANDLSNLGVKTIKVASTDITNVPFIKKLFKLKKKLIISTGATNLKELSLIIKMLKIKKKNVTILHCISYYPTEVSELNLRVIPDYFKRFKLKVGFSDHSLSLIAGAVAVSVGAKVIEKHITLDKNLEGPDHKASMEPDEFNIYVKNIRETEKILGNKKRNLSKNESDVKKTMQKSIFLNKDKKKNDIINKHDLVIMRPATSIKPYNLEKIIGKRIKLNKKAFKVLKINEF